MRRATANRVRTVWWWLAALLLCAGPGQALSQTLDTTVFGPKQYARTGGGSPNQYTDSFSVPGTVGAPFQIRIVNGDASGANRTSTAWVTLNGVQIAGPNDFSQNVAVVTRTVNLSHGNNSLQVRISGSSGALLRISALGTLIKPIPTSLTPDPLKITAGAAGTLTARIAPAPAAAGVLALASANPAVASVPSGVAYSAGQTQVAIPVTGAASGNTAVTATLNGSSVSSTIQVRPAPPTITSLLPSSLLIAPGASASLTLTISSAQPAPTPVLVLSNHFGVAFVFPIAVVPAGSVSVQVPVYGISQGTAQITASLNGSSDSSQVTVQAQTPATVVSLLPAVSTVTLGANTNLALTISSAQPADTTVALAASPAGIVTVPAAVTVPAGQTQVQVSVGTVAYGQAGITASLNGSSASAAINVVPPPVAVTALEPASFTMTVGATSSFTVRINAAQVTNTEIALAVDDPAVLQVPATATVAQGQTSATFTATALSTGNAVITASANNTQRTATVHVSPQAAAIASLLPSPLPLQQGATGSLSVTINVAQETDAVVTLANSAPSVATTPDSITIAAGSLAAAIPVTAIAPGSADITASLDGTSATSTVTVTPPPPVVTSLEPATLTLPKGTPGVLRVNVSRAPNAATAVALTSTSPGIASVPPEVNIPAGALFAEFPVVASSEGQVAISATLNGASAAASVTIAPAELVTLALSPQTPTNYVGDTVPFTATGTMTDGTTQDFTTRVTWTSSDMSVATIASTGVASALAQGTTTIAASYGFTAAQTGQPVTLMQSTLLTVKQPVALVLTAPTTSLEVPQSVTVTVTTADPAPNGGLVVTLSGAGSGAATFQPSVTIPENGTSATFILTAAAAGQFTLTATAQNRLSGLLALTLQPQFAITGFTPASGPIGTAVAIAGAGFNPNLSGNSVRFNGEQAVIVSGNATLLNAIVPPRATTGPISVTNFRGTVTSAMPFTVQDREAFDIVPSPAAIQLPLGGSGSTRLRLSSTGLNPYPYAASVTVTGLPAGVTAAFDRPTIALGQDAILTLSAASSAASGTYTLTVTATGAAGVTTQVRTKTIAAEVLAAGATTITGRVVHADDDAPFAGARVRLGGIAVFADDTGTYRFVNPPLLGDQVLLIDGSPANTAQFEYPSGIAMPVVITAGQDNKVLTSFIQKVDATKFTSIVPGQAASVTNPDIPNFSLNIPQGATLTGWDNQPITKINVRTVSVDRLPIRPLPDGVATRSVYLYYFFREGGATPSQPIPVSMANDLDALPGDQIEMWYYDESATPDPSSNQWRVMGMGTVSADGKMIVSNPGVGIPKFCCGASFSRQPPGGGGTGGNGGNGGNPPSFPPPPTTCNPVDLASGNAQVLRLRPFGTSKLMGLNPNCQYRSTDTRIGLFGRGMSFTYDWFAQQVGDAVRVTNPDGAQFMLSKEADGGFRARSGRSGAIDMEVQPTQSGRKLRMADGTEYDFDTAGRLTAIKDVSGPRTTFQLNSQGVPVSMTDPAGKVYQFEIFSTGPRSPQLITKITDPAGRFIRLEYDASLRLSRYTDQGGFVTLIEYDSANRISKVTDPRTAVKQIEYDADGRATREVLPEGAEERYSYLAAGTTVAQTRYTDPNGNTTSYRFNGLGYETSVTDALGRVTRTDRDPVTNLTRKRVDPAGRITQYSYNQRGDLVRVIDPNGATTLIEYDLRFRKPIRIENALGHVTTMDYDGQGNVTRLVSAENETTIFTYTPQGKIESVTDPLNRVARFSYDAEGNLLSLTNAANETATRSYDIANRLIETTDGLSRTRRFAYDNLDRVTEIRDAAEGLSKFAFDANDNLLSATDAGNNVVERNVYDLRDRLTRRTDAKNLDTVFVYDGMGNTTRITDRRGQTTTYTYDALNRVAQVQDNDGRTMTYSYDLAGNLARISDSASGEMLMSYDKSDRLIEVVTSQGTVSYAYDAIGRRISRAISGGDVTTYTYDKVNRLRTVTMRGKTASYGYDAAGRLTEKTLPNGMKAVYEYDLVDRVTQIRYVDSNNLALETVTYAYDAGGQRIRKSVGSASIQETPFVATYDEANRLSTIAMNGETFVLSYDSNGNLASKAGPVSGTTTYTWNARNQLVDFSGPSGTASFKYDAMGRRVEKTVNGVTTGFLYDGSQAIAELKGGAIDAVYHTGTAIDEVLARYGASGSRTFLTDALLSVIAQANDDQSFSTLHGFSPYGETVTLGAESESSLKYTGREDDGTGLYYYRARYYDPLLKRFISEDPIGLAGGMNVYAYVRGNPVNFSDPMGLLPTCITSRISERTEYSYEKEITDSWTTIIPVPMGKGMEPDNGPPKPKSGKPGKWPTGLSPAWELQAWEVGFVEWTSYLVETVIKRSLRTCSEWRTIKDECGRDKPWFYFDERELTDTNKNRMVWGKWKEWYERLVMKPKF